MSIFSAEGALGSPGMVMMSPVSTTQKPAPAESLMSRTGTTNLVGVPSAAGSVLKEY